MIATFEISGMHCQSCAIDITETLEETTGVQGAKVSFDGKQAVIEFDENQNTAAQLAEIINDLGYAATVTETRARASF